MSGLLDAHERRLATVVIPSTRLLIEFSSRLHKGSLALDLEGESAADSTDGIEILQLDLGAVFLLTDRSHGNVHIAAHLALLHVGIADFTVDKDLPECCEVGEGLFWGSDVGLRDDLHERGAGTVEINAAGSLEMETLRHILFEMDAGEPDLLAGGRDRLLCILRIGRLVQWDVASETEGLVVLGDLVVLRHVRIVVVLTVELADLGNITAKH